MICSSCGNEFLQPFVCTTCGAQKLRDETVKALEAEVRALRKSGIGLIGILEEILYAISIDKNCSERTRTAAATLEQRIKAAREGK